MRRAVAQASIAHGHEDRPCIGGGARGAGGPARQPPTANHHTGSNLQPSSPNRRLLVSCHKRSLYATRAFWRLLLRSDVDFHQLTK